MSNPKKTHELIRQNEQIVKKSQKHDANLQKNSTIYFQIGLIVCLFTVYGLFEMKFETTIPPVVNLMPPDEPVYVHIPEIRPIVPEYVEPVEQSKSKSSENFKEVIDFEPFDPIKKEFRASDIVDPPISSDDVVVEIKPVDDAPVHFLRIEQVPIYPGCEKARDNNERKQCMSEKITKLVQRKFDGTIASDYGLSGKQKIDVQFTIDKTGHIKDVKTRSPHPKLDEEAERVINILPKMLPGKQRDKPVGVIYTLPIVFDVQ